MSRLDTQPGHLGHLLITHEDLHGLYDTAGSEWVSESAVVHSSRPWLELRKVLNLSQSPSKQPPSVPADVREQLQRASILSILPQMVPLSAWDADDDGRGNQRNGTDCRVPRTGVASICLRLAQAP